MMYLTLKKKPYAIPTSWEEMTPSRHGTLFVTLAGAMDEFESGRRDFEGFRVAAVLALLGIRKVERFTDTMSENIFRLADVLSFPYSLRTMEDGRTVADLTVKLSENLLPVLGHVSGYVFRHDVSGRMDCSLTAEQYIDALSLMQAWQNSRQDSALYSLMETLYPGAHGYRRQQAVAVYYNFRGILSWIRAIPDYALIFSTDGSAAGKNPVGLASSIYSLAKAGYGNINTIKDLPLFDYLDLLLQQTVESIRTLAATNMKTNQIAERLGLPVELILEYTSKP